MLQDLMIQVLRVHYGYTAMEVALQRPRRAVPVWQRRGRCKASHPGIIRKQAANQQCSAVCLGA